MEHTDYLMRAVAAKGELRVVAVTTTSVLESARERHQMTTIASAVLGRAMGATLLLASSMKEPQARVNLRIAGDGAIGLIVADAGQDGTVRGFVHQPQLENIWCSPHRLDIASAVGVNGFLRVMRDIGYGEPYCSTVELVSGEIGADISWYLASSEQTLAKLILGEYIEAGQIRRTGGVLIQALPRSAHNEQLLAQLEPQITDYDRFSQLLAVNQSIEEIVQALLGDMDLVTFATKPVEFRCRCSFERMMGAIAMLGADEIRDMILTDGGAEVTCHFCSKVYRVDRPQLENLLAEMTAKT